MASAYQINNKRIARNTILLYFRMIIIMAISLYTSRVVLAALGVVDFGINNVVAGAVAMLAFMNNSMATSTQRFLNISMGKNDNENTKIIFRNAIRIHFIIGLAIVVLCETIGLWFVNCKLVIPADRIVAANWLFQLTILSFFINITQVPYNAAIIAHERMDIYAYISIIEVLLKLVIVYLLTVIPIDKLITYAILKFLVTQCIRIMYRFYCISHFPECKSSFVKGNSQYKEMFRLAGWNSFGNLAWILRDQGVNILLNLFFGPVVNAARGIAMQVSLAINNFVTNFTTSLKPQITKQYAQGKIKDMELLTYRGSRFSFFLLFLVAFPLLINVEYVLNLWLTEVPDFTIIFLRLIIVEQFANVLFGAPMKAAMLATGNIKLYQIVVSTILLFIVPIGYCVLKAGSSPQSVFIVMICCTLLSGIARYCFCIKQIGFQWQFFIKNVIFRIILTLVFALPLPLYLKLEHCFVNSTVEFIILCILCFLCTVFSVIIVGMTRHERSVVVEIITRKIFKR